MVGKEGKLARCEWPRSQLVAAACHPNGYREDIYHLNSFKTIKMLIYHTHRFGVYIASASVSCCPEERQLPACQGGAARAVNGTVADGVRAAAHRCRVRHRPSRTCVDRQASRRVRNTRCRPGRRATTRPEPGPGACGRPRHASPVGSPGQQQVVGSQERNCCASAEATSAATTTKQKRIVSTRVLRLPIIKTSHAFASFVVFIHVAAMIVNTITNF